MLTRSAHTAEALIVSDMHRLARLDQQFVWHPFTQMRDWLRREPIVIVEGQGAVLKDESDWQYSFEDFFHSLRSTKVIEAAKSQWHCMRFNDLT